MRNYSNVKAIVLDKDGVFVDFKSLWLRVIALRAQKIAEIATDNWDNFNEVRTACIRSMGVDEEDESIDPDAPNSMPADMVKQSLITACYITIIGYDPLFSWQKASQVVEDAMLETSKELDSVELSTPIDGAIEKIKELAKNKFKIAVFTSDSKENTKKTLKKFGITSLVEATQAGEHKTAKVYAKLCKKLKLKPEQTLLISDCPNDIHAASESGALTLGVLSGVVSPDKMSYLKVCADDVIKSLSNFNLDKVSKKKVLK